METSIQQMYGFQLCEYLLIIEPTDPVQKQIRAFKQYFIRSCRYPNAIVSKGHITLMKFVQYDSYEKPIIREFQRLAAGIMPFDITLQGFGNFGHTLFVDVKSTGPIRELVTLRRRELRSLLRAEGFDPYFVTKPHVTIARNLTPTQTETIWPIWNRTRYCGSFRARQMVLLKRPVGSRAYSVVDKFNFLGLIPRFTQGKLFA
ncbi:2'-5' RNA ligase [Parapedobacter composti]|uniref:2'-5' RNA ligase n=1 Tax=Parapedobacter composti TaxID=623281 RepID=A0A1I1F199_9SPHI|nr:2'-5' RNA ligase family protein [Parapedobacter composti]SFB93175.1 2'-5' RNA ligase [Parapedobacter composti]